MQSTMQDVPLTLSRILAHGATVHGRAQVTTWTGEGRPDRRSFAEIGARAAQLAHALRDLGVEAGEPTGTLMWNNAEHMEAYFAIPCMGAVLHTLNLRLAPEQLVWIVNHAADRVVLVNGSLLPLLAPLLPRMETVEHLVVVGPGDTSLLAGCRPAVHDYETLLAGRPTTYDWPELDERHPAAMCYTSGTTGDPKGVVYSHRSIYLHSMQVNMAESFGLTSRDTSLPIVPMFHVLAWGLPHAAFLAGIGLLLTDRFLQPAAIAEMIETERPTHAAAVPTIWQGLLGELAARERDISSLRAVVIGGSACPPSLMRDFEERHGVTVVQAWGMTETSPLGSIAHPPATVTDPDEAWPYRITQGRFPASVEARLIGPDGDVLPWDGESAGELEVRGPWIAGAYHGGAGAEPVRPDDKFRDGWLRTGDVGTITPDGYLTLTDRAKDVIKSGGEWISSVELENHLMAHPEVAEAAVVAVPDDKWGERPLATVVLRPGATAGFAELREFLALRVARWQLPERWSLLESVPKTSVGKFDKKVLRKRYADGELAVETL
ncbi:MULTISPECIES: long-chain fatty acid--CoA ligase [Streptomycetaceae]|uniref:Putative fatty acid CoA ligase n=1 Tax=Streptantibioticus cattleyicolor (strain ATCC 35852 / DSM 46488 / JCM 4925 / NBRC 14057 / NRRL 8057) TaxID=1003195 RepID=F8JR59_STREN|nr:long-chain fatty acid--CoA ligase [Streptantibioticus cattleyicolor]AEW95355.1 putative fatty acid CoA ligase [Streptantibioticus cattleyicolor NRRL 8057 = DSM 46488]MYS59931.1 long-chain-fatty-acid--CoA ligase [Streptomyces sp. SID5468]CCB75699.1 Medium-chain-fatty-acid--CoA ligase [Streptantibioticus cattleyicolor NRRL 8057 = DSM 46488]